MFLNSHRYNPFEYFDRAFDNSFFESNDITDLFSHLSFPKRLTQSKEEQMKRALNNLSHQENQITDTITYYENHIQQLKKAKEQIDEQKARITEQIAKHAETKKQQSQTKSLDHSKTSDNQNHLFKKFYYKTDDMEVEEQYDSSNPKNCFKIIRKQGEAPQIISGEQRKQQIESTQQDEKHQTQTVERCQDDKYQQFCNLAGKSPNEMKTFYEENKDLTIGQLYDKATEQKII